MFEECHELTVLNFPNFDISLINNVLYIKDIFKGCNKLEYINFNNYNETENLIDINNILESVKQNLVICIDINNNVEKLLVEINKKQCPIIYCNDDWKSRQKILIPGNDTCEIEDQYTSIISTEIIKKDTNRNNYINTTFLDNSFYDKNTNIIINIDSKINSDSIIDSNIDPKPSEYSNNNHDSSSPIDIIFSSQIEIDSPKDNIIDKSGKDNEEIYN